MSNSNLFIEFCDFRDRPIGGQLTFAKNFLSLYQGKSKYIGLASAGESLGRWLDFPSVNTECERPKVFFVGSVGDGSCRPLVPVRLKVLFDFIQFVPKLRKVQFDTVIVQSPEALFCARLLKYKAIIYRFAGTANPLEHSRYKAARIFSGIFWWIFCRYLRNVKLIFATAGEAEIRELSSNLKSNGVKAAISFLPTLVDDHVFEFSNCAPLDCPRFIMVGRLNAGKRCDLVLDAFSRVLNRFPKAKLVIVGDGEEGERLKSFASELKIENSVDFAGACSPDQTAALLRSSNIFVLASEREGWPTALVEAVSVGLYCVSTNVSGANVILDTTERGVVLESHRSTDFESAMLSAWDFVSGGERRLIPDKRYLKSSLGDYFRNYL